MLIAGTGNTLSAFVEYYLGTHIGTATNFVEQKKKLPFGLGKLKVESPMFLIGARMIPGYGPKVVSMMAGIYHVPVLRYLWTTAIPIFAGAALFAFGGRGIALLANIKITESHVRAGILLPRANCYNFFASSHASFSSSNDSCETSRPARRAFFSI